MKIIAINSKEYTLEYTMEASLYKDGIEELTRYMMRMDPSMLETPEAVISSIADLPHAVLKMFYAGLLEYHSEEVKSEKDAKKLLKEYFAEHKEDETGNFYGMMGIVFECMKDDGFFNQLGLTQMLAEEEPTEKVTKIPQDHKKKQTTKAGDK
jgi:hypothetical protein